MTTPSPLVIPEPRLRIVLPADLYAEAWGDPSAITLIRVFEHLRILQHIKAAPMPVYALLGQKD